MNKISTFICIDAGGTTSKVNIYDLDGNILHKSIVGVGSPAITKDLEFKTLDVEIEKIINKYQDIYDVKNITMGISGLGVVPVVQKVVDIFENKYHIPTIIVNDAVIALYSIVAKSPIDIVENKCPDGILVLGGTGSAICGIKDGVMHLVGGWGHFIGERGSAYALVHQASLRMIKRYENKEELLLLDETLLKAMEITTPPQLKSVFYLRSKGDIAAYASIISEFAEEGNDEAIDIIIEEAKAIINGVKTLVRTEQIKNNSLFGFKGGVFKENGLIVEMVQKLLLKEGYEYNYIIDETDPIVGAYYLAKATYLKETKNA
jgi:N-acetylglucosamine kinase-like BadF-type ATPase